ncbi:MULTISPECIES: trypsin-like peptidase domain-containing protein [unclassified Carboxylicivirga]|uniref:trypsin-like peptidase domain-containing protein n=1 Tax=Carboxylicivirga TaxID=1628153 RepID=UPI003D3464EB
MIYNKLYGILLFLLFPFSLHSQSLMEVINRTEKAVFEARTYTGGRTKLAKASGFFISADGLAITMGHIFERADSAVITMRSGRTFGVDRIIALHPKSNLALIKVKQARQKTFSFLLPARQSFRQHEELLFFTHPLETEDGITLRPVHDLAYFPFLSRCGIVDGSYHTHSAGAPAINRHGRLCGIVNVSKDGKHKILYNSYLLNDTNWVTINKPVSQTYTTDPLYTLFNPMMSEALLYIISNEPIEAAKKLSRHLKKHPEDDEAYCLRAYARFHYQNLVGSRADLNICHELNPTGFLQYFFKATFALTHKKDEEARTNFTRCLDYKKDFAPAISQLAALNYARSKDVRTAFAWYSRAIEADSLLAQAYYERARLRLQHSNDQATTLLDINKSIYLEPDLPGIYSIRGSVYFSNQDYLLAISDFDQAIERDIKDVHAWFSRGVANYNIGLHQQACNDWNKAGQLGNYDAYKYMARYCKDVKRNVYDQ